MEIQALQDHLDNEDSQYLADIPCHITVALTALKALHRSMRREHYSEVEDKKSEEYGGESHAKETTRIYCRKLSREEARLRDTCCESIASYIDICSSLIDTPQNEDDPSVTPGEGS